MVRATAKGHNGLTQERRNNMKAPDKIYLQVCGECPEEDCKNCKFEDLEDNVTWCKDRIYKKDIEYIRKDALLEWAKENEKRLGDLLTLNNQSLAIGGKLYAYQELIEKIESL